MGKSVANLNFYPFENLPSRVVTKYLSLGAFMTLKITAASEIKETALLGAPPNTLLPNSVFGHFLVLFVEKQLQYYITR